MKPLSKFLKYMVFTMAGVAAVSLAVFAYAQKSDLPEGWEEPAQQLPSGTIRLEDVGRPKSIPPAQPAPTAPAPAAPAPAPAPAPVAPPPPAAAAPAPAAPPPSGAMSDLPEGWEEPAQPLPAGTVKIEDVGKKPAPAKTAPSAAEEPRAPTKKAVEETEVIGEEEKGEESHTRPSRWKNL